MLSFRDALERWLAGASLLGTERVALESAAGRVLAEDLVAREPLPAFDYSSMDGYAVATSDLAGSGPWDLPVRGESAAGRDTPALTAGAACRIFTGARVPASADAIVAQEDAVRSDDRVRLVTRPAAGAWIRRRGEDLEAGSVALERGRRLGPGQIALAAGLDRPHLYVARRPVVTVLCSGDELRSPGDPGPPASIPESNGFFVAVAARGAGALATVAPFVRDDATAARNACALALQGSDVVVTVGGVSVGDHDVMRDALTAAGVAIDFWRVAMKPGKPLAVGRAGPVHVLGLPGNPASASLTFLLFGVPLLRALQGDRAPALPRILVRVSGSLRRSAGRQEFVRSVLQVSSGETHARLLPNQASGAITSFAAADALVVVPAECEEVRDGQIFEAIRIADI
jgi:molybdopterin molybdotransferase